MSNRSALNNVCLLGFLAFLVFSSGFVQCLYRCMEEDALRRAFSWHERHENPVADCHLTYPEPKLSADCPDRSCHQNQAGNRSLGGPVLTVLSGTLEPLLNASRLPLPTVRAGHPLHRIALNQPRLSATWQPPRTTSQALLGVKSTVLLI